MYVSTEKRITDAARRLATLRVSKKAERQRDHAFVRSTKALDPDTPYGRKSRR